MFNDELIIIRGGGDLATGIIQKFYRSGFKVLVLETKQPLAIRKTVALCQCVYEVSYKVEDIKARLVINIDEMQECWNNDEIPVVIDPKGQWINKLAPGCVIDAIIAKRNMGTYKSMAKNTIGIGPGFSAGVDVDIVIESMRGHDLGRLIFKNSAYPNTGVPGEIGGKANERVIHAPCHGKIEVIKNIGDIVDEKEPILKVGNQVVCAPFSGLIRGMIEEGLEVKEGLKIADIDPRTDIDCFTISDKARNLGGAALEAYLYLRNRR